MEKIISVEINDKMIKDMMKSKSKPEGTKRKAHRNVKAKFSENISHAAEAFTSEEDINRMIQALLDKKFFFSAALFVTGINVGCRCGDLLSFKVEDLISNSSRKCKKEIYLIEEKTGKTRKIYLNQAVRTTLEWLVKEKQLKPNEFLFQSNGNKKAYIDEIVYDDNGNVIDVKTTGKPKTADGNKREYAPMTIQNVSFVIKQTAKELNIDGHFSSHCMRKTFVEFISRDWNDNRNAIVASAALNHADVSTTMNYYMGVNPQKLKEKWHGLNLGLSVMENYISK